MGFESFPNSRHSSWLLSSFWSSQCSQRSPSLHGESSFFSHIQLLNFICSLPPLFFRLPTSTGIQLHLFLRSSSLCRSLCLSWSRPSLWSMSSLQHLESSCSWNSNHLHLFVLRFTSRLFDLYQQRSRGSQGHLL